MYKRVYRCVGGLLEHLAQVTQPGRLVSNLHPSSSKPLGLPLQPVEALCAAVVVGLKVFLVAMAPAW